MRSQRPVVKTAGNANGTKFRFRSKQRKYFDSRFYTDAVDLLVTPKWHYRQALGVRSVSFSYAAKINCVC